MKKLWLLRNMKKSGLNQNELKDAYAKEVRSLLEMAVPVWHSGLTALQTIKIERVQKAALAIITGENEFSYKKLLKSTNLENLQSRRTKMCKEFIKKNIESEVPLLSKTTKTYNTRDKSKVVREFQCRTSKYYKSALPYLARLFNAMQTE